jgi:hypothetical protein
MAHFLLLSFFRHLLWSGNGEQKYPICPILSDALIPSNYPENIRPLSVNRSLCGILQFNWTINPLDQRKYFMNLAMCENNAMRLRGLP